MGFGIHGDERAELRQTRIDHPSGTGIFEADLLDHQVIKLAHGHAIAEIGHLGRLGIRIDRAADQDQRLGLRLGRFLGQNGGGCQSQRCRLADRDHIGVGAQMADEVDQILRVILDVEFPGAHRNVTRIVPIRHIDIAIGQQ